MRAVLDALLFPLLLAVGLVATHLGLAGGVSAEVVTTSVAVLTLALVAPLERLWPERVAFRPLDQPLRVLLGHFLLGAELGTALGIVAALVLGQVLAEASRAAWGVAPWPEAWPWPVQLVAGLALADAAGYVQHRALHAHRSLWPFHAVHHAVGRLGFTETGRFHVVDFATATFLSYVPLIALGAPEALLTWVAAVTTILGILQHANVRMRTAPLLDLLVCTPAVHWRHHARAEPAGNYATIFPLVDAVLGTYRGGADRERVDIGADAPPPDGLRAQLLEPFRAAARAFRASR